MKKSSRRTLCAVVLSFAFGCAAAAVAQQTGGYKAADKDDPEVVAAAEFAVGARGEQEGSSLALVTVERAEIQVVAGRNYRLCMEVKAEGDDEESLYVLAVVYQNLQRQYSLSSWEESACADTGSGGHHAPPSRSPRSQSEDELRALAEGSEGPHDPSPKYIRALQKKYPGMPTDIIPKRHK